jgi:hypothetical protein
MILTRGPENLLATAIDPIEGTITIRIPQFIVDQVQGKDMVTHGVNPITNPMCNSLMGPFINPLGTPGTPTLNSLSNHLPLMQKLWRCSRKIGNIIAEIREN